MRSFDAVVVGGGIAGVSLASEIASSMHTAVLEAEPVLGWHATGRSAAAFLETYGGRLVRQLTMASRSFFESPPEGFPDSLMHPRSLLWIGAPGSEHLVEALHVELAEFQGGLEVVDEEHARIRCPVLRPGQVGLGLVESDAADLDVHALHAGFVDRLRDRGGAILPRTRLVEANRVRGMWEIRTSQNEALSAGMIVNAAGAWADEVATAAGVESIGVSPLRRTAFVVPGPSGVDATSFPLVCDVNERFYFRPEGAQLLCSPADEIPSAPCDAKPDQIDIARAIDAINEATTLGITHVRSAWAGLRTFVEDREPVVGWDPITEGFFWCAGQGGFGIQTAPALARIGSQLLTTGETSADFQAIGLTSDALGPSRLSGAS